MKYSDYFMKSLHEFGYTTCYYLGGGNSMHLLESASKYFDCIPVVHEVTAAIASEYFNLASQDSGKAFALVTAGPGLTNLVTGIAGAWLDSRELLVIGGQAKSSNLSTGNVRQIGHQEVRGAKIVEPICKVSKTITQPISNDEIYSYISKSWLGRKGTVFLEICLDVSAQEISLPFNQIEKNQPLNIEKDILEKIKEELTSNLENCQRPILLLGGGVSRELAIKYQSLLVKYKIPIACTWTGADRCNEDYSFYAGRPNTYGMRWANIFQQQSDLLIVVGSSLGFQQTGFNTNEFLPVGKLIHVDIENDELTKPNPRERIKFNIDANTFFDLLGDALLGLGQINGIDEWISFLFEIRKMLPILEDCQKSKSKDFVSPHEVIDVVSELAEPNARIVAASSGGTFTAAMQNYRLIGNQIMAGNKGLASMGYGLGGAIGFATKFDGQVILFEGDGGFAQNMQDIGTLIANNLNIKIFLTSNNGYASIRTSQKSYFGGHYLGCDSITGLILPDWNILFSSYGIQSMTLNRENFSYEFIKDFLSTQGPGAMIINADPEQMYLPKITSKVNVDGTMSSNPLHLMEPQLSEDIAHKVFRYLAN